MVSHLKTERGSVTRSGWICRATGCGSPSRAPKLGPCHKSPQSRRFALVGTHRTSRQRLDCVCFSTALGSGGICPVIPGWGCVSISVFGFNPDSEVQSYNASHLGSQNHPKFRSLEMNNQATKKPSNEDEVRNQESSQSRLHPLGEGFCRR